MKINKKLGDVVFEGSQFNIYRKKVCFADGISRVLETAACSDVIRVYPVDSAKQLLLIREFHYTIGTDILRSVSGQIKESETAAEAAQRELQEEIGMEAEHLECFATSRPILKVDCVVHHFLATGLREKRREVDEGELIETVTIPLSDVPTLVTANQIHEDVIALNLLRLCQKLRVFEEKRPH